VDHGRVVQTEANLLVGPLITPEMSGNNDWKELFVGNQHWHLRGHPFTAEPLLVI
jgi:hypothetical protein